MTTKEIEERKAAALEDQALQLEWQNALLAELAVAVYHYKWDQAGISRGDGIMERRDEIMDRVSLMQQMWNTEYRDVVEDDHNGVYNDR